MIGIHIVPPSVEFITPKHFPNWAEGWLNLIEECGRNCYQSEPKKGDTAAKFIKRHRIHESILEHGVFTVNFVGSRAMSHQLVRHRIAAYSQESQRFCDYASDRLQEEIDDRPDEVKLDDLKALRVIMPPSYCGEILENNFVYHDGGNVWLLRHGERLDFTSFVKSLDIGEERSERMTRWCVNRIHDYAEYLEDREAGIPSEDARFALPNATKTSVMTTYNFRVWRHVLGHPVFGRALNDHAQWEIKGNMLTVLSFFEEHVPVLFEDLRQRAAA